VVSLRQFTNNAMNHHHGIQTEERFGTDVDADHDGVVNELTVGDVTAATIFQAALDVPQIVKPDHPAKLRAARRGARLFKQLDCVRCHVPQMRLRSRLFVEPNPYNPPGNLRPQDVRRPFVFDMTRDGQQPGLEPGPRGTAFVRAFTDLKRHNLNDHDYNHFANERIPQGTLLGFADASDFTMDAPPRPTEEFLTRKLWDVATSGPYGHRGDLSTMTEAIYFHGGDARDTRDAFFALSDVDQASVIEFLKVLRVVDDPAEFESLELGPELGMLR